MGPKPMKSTQKTTRTVHNTAGTQYRVSKDVQGSRAVTPSGMGASDVA